LLHTSTVSPLHSTDWLSSEQVKSTQGSPVVLSPLVVVSSAVVVEELVSGPVSVMVAGLVVVESVLVLVALGSLVVVTVASVPVWEADIEPAVVPSLVVGTVSLTVPGVGLSVAEMLVGLLVAEVV
jgi:hypothetical protein